MKGADSAGLICMTPEVRSVRGIEGLFTAHPHPESPPFHTMARRHGARPAAGPFLFLFFFMAGPADVFTHVCIGLPITRCRPDTHLESSFLSWTGLALVCRHIGLYCFHGTSPHNRARRQSGFPTFISCQRHARRQRAAPATTIAPRWQTLWRQHGPFGTLARIFGPRISRGRRTPFGGFRYWPKQQWRYSVSQQKQQQQLLFQPFNLDGIALMINLFL